MNDKISIELQKSRVFEYFYSEHIIILVIIFAIYVLGVLGFFFSLIVITAEIIVMKYLYLKSATKLNSVDNILEVKLPFQKPIIIPLENISKIEKTGKWARGMRYFVIEYDDKKINTYIMSSGLKENLYGFMEELERRVNTTKSLASIKND